MGNVLYIDKPKNMTSFDVCHKLRKILNTKKIGHTGTLDPSATGVMIILFDKATKANQFLVSDKKEYVCDVILGIETDTLDLDGNIIREKECVCPNEDKINEVLNSFLGETMQEVPLTSAISVNGKRLYEYQRQKIKVELPVRKIYVYEIKLLEINDKGFKFSCRVSSGTYIRALVRDICKKLDVIGTTAELRRTMIDDINVEMCDSLDEVLKGNYHSHDLYDLLSKRYECFEYEPIKDIYNGIRIKLDCDKQRVLITNNDEAIAIYEKDGDYYKSVRGLF